MIGLDVMGIRLSTPEGPPVLLLKEMGGSRVLPIWIGNVEAAAIAVALEGEQTLRPMTHDLLAKVLALLAADADDGRVSIDAVDDGVFLATVSVGGHEVEARPSDCVAVALRLGWPIECPRSLLDEVGVEAEPTSTDEVEAFRAFLDSVNADDFEDGQ